MNNEEKAIEIASDNYQVYHVSLVNRVKRMTSESEFYQSAIEMSRFKDQQFIKFLEDRMGDEISVKMIEEFKKIIN